MLTPRAPHHNGVRQFLPLFPFLGMLAGLGLERARGALGHGGVLVVGALALLPPAAQTAAIHPFYLSYYGEAVGGLRGADRLGFERTYWMDVVSDDVFEWMNRELPRDARVLVLGQHRALELARAYGRVRRDLEFVGEPPADYYLVPMSDFVIGPTLRSTIERVRPLYVLERDGVTLVAIYRLEADAGGPPEEEPAS